MRVTPPVIVEVTPLRSLMDEPLAITLRGAVPGADVGLVAKMWDRDGQAWQAHATFQADAEGAVDVTRDAPTEGSYEGADAMALIWSMANEGGSPAYVFPMRDQIVPITIEAWVDGTAAASVTVERLRWASGVEALQLREEGLQGVLSTPPGPDPAPGVLVLGGSGRLPPVPTAGLLSSRGMTALALAYFGAPGLPARLREIPVEYFGRALAWLTRHPRVRGSRVLVHGASRGGELALLLGATFAEVAGVVAVVPSGLIHSSPGSEPPAASWTYRGQPLPFAKREDAASLGRAAIPVERIDGPVLLLSAADDRMWPSARLAEYAERRLEERHHPYFHEHVVYPNAGHGWVQPYRPITQADFRHPVSGRIYAAGGTRVGNAFAASDSWRRTLAFLAEAATRL